ncbi:hypothetical protein KAK06_04265 [Ideonella sp. 4Y11]|uniref:Uncharacterized protein n=1 Tax=Ideonella aquatica TaxID=2824119 RepID=A0A940YJE6_9BURK|nr:hypothetical protein [Ideonella aquatica]MBQ0958162.1 hypothetical protein [Ideonella aquatica]
MKLSNTMLRGYLRRIALGYLGRSDEPSEDPADFDASIDEVRLAAEAAGDLPWLKLGLDHLLTTPGIRLRDYCGDQFPYTEHALYDLFLHTWQVLWPDEPLSAPGEGALLELEEMPTAQWVAFKAGG